MDATAVTLFQRLIPRTGRSLLQYVSESSPWATTRMQSHWPAILAMAEDEREAVATLIRYVTKQRHRTPYLGSYPLSFTTINFISLDHLLPLLVDYDGRRVAELEADLAAVQDPEAREILTSMLDLKRRHLQDLRGMVQTPPVPVPA